jgi:AcrR family transcriptional regulator
MSPETGTPIPAPPLSGRRAQAARNDERILESARAVFVADPGAPIAAVAKNAGVGISALYKRYASKEELLRTICADGMQRFQDEVEAALADERDAWTAFADFMRRAVEADTNSLTAALAGTFTPSEEMFAQAAQLARLMDELFARTMNAGVLREDLAVHDVSYIFEQLAAIGTKDPERTAQLRSRYLALFLDGIRRPPGREPLPGPAPGWAEINERWQG